MAAESVRDKWQEKMALIALRCIPGEIATGMAGVFAGRQAAVSEGQTSAMSGHPMGVIGEAGFTAANFSPLLGEISCGRPFKNVTPGPHGNFP
jgi:hypothetical protein